MRPERFFGRQRKPFPGLGRRSMGQAFERRERAPVWDQSDLWRAWQAKRPNADLKKPAIKTRPIATQSQHGSSKINAPKLKCFPSGEVMRDTVMRDTESSPRILIVDDEFRIALVFLRGSFWVEGFAVGEADTGPEAPSRPVTPTTQPLIWWLLDWTLPDFSGVENLRRLRCKRRPVRCDAQAPRATSATELRRWIRRRRLHQQTILHRRTASPRPRRMRPNRTQLERQRFGRASSAIAAWTHDHR